MVWMARPDGFVEYFSRRWYEYTGVGPETLGEGWSQVLHPDDFARTVDRWNASIASGQGYDIDYRLRRGRDGEYRWFLGRALPHRDPHTGQILRWFGTCTDIHDQKMAEEALRLAKEQSDRDSRAKDEFLSVLSHELRTPLSAILGWVQLLEMGVLDDAESRDAVRTIKQQAKVQSQLIEDLLEVSRIINGKFTMRHEPVPLTDVIERTLETVAPSAADKNIMIDRGRWDSRLLVEGDPQRIGQLAWNLLTNAVKFTPNGGRITVSIDGDDTHARITVADTGKGIDTEHLQRIFEHFNQADSTATRAQGGLGLGLSIVRHIVRMHGGSIEARSAGVDRGSEFVVTLPRLKTVASPPAPSNARRLGPDALGGLSILVVDDEESARVVAEASLTKFGATVLTASSANEALHILANGTGIDVVISDIGMPVVSGFELVRSIRASVPPVSGIPAIALTAFASIDDQTRALDAGFNAHVAKPLDAPELVRQVLGVLGR